MAPLRVFWNRTDELKQLRRALRHGGFGLVTGRRRVGKTALLGEICQEGGGLYHQAVEGTPQQQILHLAEEFQSHFPILKSVVPKSWVEFLSLLSREKWPSLVVFDEFPYWVQGDPTLPSVLQEWVDHELPKHKTLLLVSGSSQSMLHSHFLRQESPLFGRADFHLNLDPLPYEWFCRALHYNPLDPLTFSRYSIVGGVPHYWRMMPRGSLLEQVEELYYRPSAPLAAEPSAWLTEEGVSGTVAKALVDLIGRGVSKPGELASRLGLPQGNLSRPLALLLDLGFVNRESPFGQTPRSTKKVLYTIQDPALRFYYSVYLPTRHRWGAMDSKEKLERIHQHVARQWEIFCRSRFPGGGRYWESLVEIDVVARIPSQRAHLVGECKWRALSSDERAGLTRDLERRFISTRLSSTLSPVEYRILGMSDIGSLLQQHNV
ncbi:MAG: ATP-binding protein [Elusimicrobia bacterium]|nr:ATP-binding protein [Elusimicrobiota bacterium]